MLISPIARRFFSEFEDPSSQRAGHSGDEEESRLSDFGPTKHQETRGRAAGRRDNAIHGTRAMYSQIRWIEGFLNEVKKKLAFRNPLTLSCGRFQEVAWGNHEAPTGVVLRFSCRQPG